MTCVCVRVLHRYIVEKEYLYNSSIIAFQEKSIIWKYMTVSYINLMTVHPKL